MKTLENENNRRHNNGSVPHREGIWPIPDDIRFIRYVAGKCILDRSINVLSVSYTVHIRFVRYRSVTRTAMSVS